LIEDLIFGQKTIVNIRL